MCARTCDWRSGSAPPPCTYLVSSTTTNDTVTIFTVPKAWRAQFLLLDPLTVWRLWNIVQHRRRALLMLCVWDVRWPVQARPAA